MKARWLIFGVLLLAFVVSPSEMRAIPHVPRMYPCPIAKTRVRNNYARQSQRAPREVAYSLPGHHRPAPRLHRIRGKKISIERSFIAATGSALPSRYVFAISPASLEGPDGPNPSRGPPSQSL
jgi:hypothetical protein